MINILNQNKDKIISVKSNIEHRYLKHGKKHKIVADNGRYDLGCYDTKERVLCVINDISNAIQSGISLFEMYK